jgi:flagellar biosynthesis/type III secretory pathway protein FliH
MKLVVHAADLRIAVNPTQRETLAGALPRLSLQWPALAHVELLDDASIAPGGCRLYTRQGSVDADLDVQLRNIAADLVPGV